MAEKTVTLSLEEIDPFWRLHAYAEGRVLSAEDVKDIQQVLNDYNDEIGENVDRHQAAREQVLREIGGEELVELAAKADSAQSAVAVERAMAHFRAKCLEYEGKVPAPSTDKLVEALKKLLAYFGGPQGVSMAELGHDAYVSLEMKVRIGDLIDARRVLNERGQG